MLWADLGWAQSTTSYYFRSKIASVLKIGRLPQHLHFMVFVCPCQVFSEDPVLTSALVLQFVTGAQLGNQTSPKYMQTAACCKHFAAYDLESIPTNRRKFNAIVSPWTMQTSGREAFLLYLFLLEEIRPNMVPALSTASLKHLHTGPFRNNQQSIMWGHLSSARKMTSLQRVLQPLVIQQRISGLQWLCVLQAMCWLLNLCQQIQTSYIFPNVCGPFL